MDPLYKHTPRNSGSELSQTPARGVTSKTIGFVELLRLGFGRPNASKLSSASLISRSLLVGDSDGKTPGATLSLEGVFLPSILVDWLLVFEVFIVPMFDVV